jgi:hypothetical protein
MDDCRASLNARHDGGENMARRTISAWLTALMLGTTVFATGCAGHGGDETDSGTGAATATSAPATLGTEYQGTIKDLKVMFRLAATGSAVTGSYFYVGKATAGDPISLKGTLTGSKLHLDETTLGQKTGSMDVTVTNGQINGQWIKPDGSLKLNLALTAVPTGTLLPITRTIDQTLKATQPNGGVLPTCTLKADYIEVFGIADKTAENAINTKLAVPQLKQADCDFGSSQTTKETIGLNESGLFVVSTSSDFDGGAHPDTSLQTSNFDLKTGKALGAPDIFKPDALDKLKQLMIGSLDPSLDADGKQTATDQINQASLEEYNCQVEKDGIHVDLFDAFPHVILSLAPEVDLKWADIKDLLQPNTVVTPLVH